MVTAVVGTLAGAALVVAVWSSVVLTVFTPRGRPTRLVRGVVRAFAGPLLAVAGRVPAAAREPLLDLCGPLAVCTVAGIWVGVSSAGFALLEGTPLGEAEWASGLLLVAVIATYLVQFSAAYGRRERLVARLAGSVCNPRDADTMLAVYLRTGSRDHLDSMFAEWTGWMAEVEHSHLAHPALTFRRPAGDLDWLKAAVIVLDVAALIEALAPSWAPAHTRALLATGTRCMHRLAHGLCITLPPIPVSLQGREERNFSDTLTLAGEAGLPAERDPVEAWDVFQDLRTGYAPHAYAIETRLRYDRVEEPDEVGD
ncbi:hypothetical protein FH608_024930 [Nonomuraea phyllanthi]|uniref:Uncharacterized protein n=1 Tax=Nonomuraea phyllanthi TaxID=2219224 RepID=A0A5C4W9D5_9ACTN|nr:hypothetical protein [Nonomuraea phyllanthi]KAB8192724.1 hypothetical protein FH608_024930 [Nonomuraea phyllanthi]QFY08201.1 hypothetical protein GBF35_17305 [Nonomuraea phyllanthi]